MEKTSLTEVTAKNLLTYVSDRVYKKWYWQDLFPLKSWPFLDYTALIGSKGAPVAADVVAYDVSAPVKTRKVIGKVSGDIPATRISRIMTESNINLYNVIKAGATPDMSALLDLIYDDVDFVIEGVMARMESLALRLISSGKVVLDKTQNEGIVTETAIDYGASYTTGAAVVWGAAVDTTTPITDIDTIMTAGEAIGVVYKYILMDNQSWLYLRNSDETKNFMIPFTVVDVLEKRIKATITLDSVNSMLRDQGYPQIVIVKQSIITETENHDQVTTNPFYAGHICFLEDLPIGNMLHGPIAEETNPPQQVVQAKTGNILVSKWRDVNPIRETTKGESNVFPVWPLIDRCYFLDTLHALTWSDPT